jgi:thioredoxin reductase
VILFDHKKPRNYAARAVHGFLGLDGIAPAELLERGRREARSYGVEFDNFEVTSIHRFDANTHPTARFQIAAAQRTIEARAVLLATGVVDELPTIPGLQQLYGVSVHHCPYCDAWEHRDKRLVALSDGASATELALSLLPWSKQVICCSNGTSLTSDDRQRLTDNGIAIRDGSIAEIARCREPGIEIRFKSGPPLICDAIFFGADQRQHSRLPALLGCEIDNDGLVRRDQKQHTCVEGVFVAGDAAGDVQFAIVAAAQGATAAAAIDHMLQQQDIMRGSEKADRRLP